MSEATDRAVLWDLDGVIAPTEEICAAAHCATVQHYGGGLFGLDFYQRIQGVGRSHEAVRTDFLTASGLQVSAAEYTRTFQKLKKAMMADLKPNPGIRELLAVLRKDGYHLGLVTTSRLSSVNEVLKICRLTEAFDLLVTADDVRITKPAPDPYLLALKRFHQPAGRVVAIEDSETGIRSAVEAGLAVIGYRYDLNDNHDFSRAKFVIDSFEDTTGLLNLIGQLIQRGKLI
ncbi:MAG: HAD family phosphatase [Candidatus Doudnabacteria bacterium]|nr:HAD family phosphatase [Candidatus Doudnabacteria bacterium]